MSAKTKPFRTVTNSMRVEVAGPTPNKAVLVERARQAATHLSEAESAVDALDRRLFGEARGSERGEPVPGLEALVDDIATRTACLVGRLGTILDRLGE